MSTEVQAETTTDSFDPNIVPAETKARKEREGVNYKHTPDNAEDADSIHTADGYTVDTEGLINNYAIEPPMYVEDGGGTSQANLPVVEKFIIVDVFSTSIESENVATEIHNAGIGRNKISVLGKNYHDAAHGYGSLNWQDIEAAGGLTKVLKSEGIVDSEARKYEAEIAAGKFLVVVIGENADVITTKEILINTGHRINALQEKV
jgi:hypothetical protein